ncbi:NADH-quinone oxidoreductase subunit N [Buchnera aphidicola (Chaitophorus sp. 3695)]|uniref:NADH-quinone oxidoreductase subunit N n=1 Tax=Buchnera aphidicola TaxID=9 RepID=UPI003463AA76
MPFILSNFSLLLPFIVLISAVIINLLIIIFQRNFFLSFLVTFISLFISFYFLIKLNHDVDLHILFLLFLKPINFFYMFIFFCSSVLTCIFSYIFLRNKNINKEEFFILLLLSNIGGYVLLLFNDMISLFLGIELLSLPLFGIIGYISSKSFKNLESSFKYFIVSCLASIFLLFGIAFIYLSFGTLDFITLISINSLFLTHFNYLFFLGIMITCLALLTKFILFPFYSWIPDIYEGIPYPILIYFSNATKIVIFLILSNILLLLPNQYSIFLLVLKIMSFLSIIVGSVLAFFQDNVKRLLGYSTIVNSGYLTLFLIFFHQNSIFYTSIKFYLLGYLINSFVLFGSMTLISVLLKDKHSNSFKNYLGIFWKNKILSISIIISLFSMTGIPLTIGFFSKFYLLKFLIEQNSILFIIIVLFGSVMSIYYYFNFIKLFFYTKNIKYSKHFFRPTKLYIILEIFCFIFSLLIITIGIFPNLIDNFVYLLQRFHI